MARGVLTLYFGFALLASTVHCEGNLPIDQLFQVSFNTEDPGNCAQYETKIKNFASHANSLVLSGLDATFDFDLEEGPAERLLNSFFINPTSADVQTIRGNIEQVQTFLENGMSTKPFLVCGDGWIQRQTTGSQMYLEGGGRLATNADGSPRYIFQDRDFYSVVQAKAKQDPPTYPYWSPITKTYFFLPSYGDGTFSDGPCVGQTGKQPPYGATYQPTAKHGPLIFLCDRTFDLPDFRTIAAAPVPASRRNLMKGNRQLLQNIMPSVNVFYHELFHLVLGTAASTTTLPDNEVEEYRAIFCTAKKPYDGGALFTKANALNNPQSYSFMTVAYDYTLRSDHVNGLPIEFYTTCCTYFDGDPNDDTS